MIQKRKAQETSITIIIPSSGSLHFDKITLARSIIYCINISIIFALQVM